MGNWRYEGFTKDGKREAGTIQASSQKEVRKLLRAKGIRPKKILSPSLLEFDITEWMIEKGIAQPFGAKELFNFTKQLSIMIGAGVPIIQGLEILYKQEKHLVLKKTIKRISSDVAEGMTIAEAMEQHKGFDKLYCNLIRAGESGGILDGILIKLSEHMEKQEKTKAQIKSAMTYPVIVTIVGIGVIWAMMVFVVPQFVGMLKDTNQAIPAITQFVIDTSKFLGDYTIYILPSVVFIIFLLKAWVANSKTGKYLFDRLMMKLPVFGGIIIKGNLSSFSRTLGTMLSSGVSLIDALDICIETIENGVISDDLKKVKRKVVQGKTLAEPLERISYFPDMVSQMIRVGEQTGQIDQMLEKTADVFEDEVSQLVSEMTKLIEPLIIVVLGGIIATILVAMYLPMFMAGGGADG
jgi:type IV pilus assembly protein PilC